MTVFSGGEAIKAFLEEFDSWLSESVTVYLLGGSAMTVHGLKDQTEDIDLALGVVSEFEHVYQTLTSQGFSVVVLFTNFARDDDLPPDRQPQLLCSFYHFQPGKDMKTLLQNSGASQRHS